MSEQGQLHPGRKVGDGRFALVRPLGRGGMGEVWLAQDQRLHESVALKFLPAEIRSDEVALDDLRRETARSHRLTHPNIVRIHDLHEEPGGLAFITMEFVDGPTLASLRLQQSDRVFRWEFLKPLVQQLCAALEYAHEEKVIHRDLKPANMMLDSRGRLKLADFGIAATVSDSASRISLRHATSGTLAYMSPQQLAGKRPSMADDIYALGATLYELLTSRPPFYTGDLTHQILNELPEPTDERLAALEIQNEIPPDVAALIMACLAKDPAQRPQSAGAVAGWIGLATEKTHSVNDVASAMFPGPVAEPELASRVEPGAARSAAMSRTKRIIFPLAAVGILLLVGLGAWQFAKHRAAQLESGPSLPANTTTRQEDTVVLFDGTSTAAWKGGKQDSFPARAWVVKDGLLSTLPAGRNAQQELVTREKFADFELEFEWRLDRGGNSGVFYGAREFQLVDEEGQPNGKVSATSCGSLYDILAPTSAKPPVPAGQFHHGKLVVNGSKVQHWINGQKILEYDLASDLFKGLVAKSRLSPTTSVAEMTRVGEMQIALQHHTGTASFRNVRLRRLSAEPPAVAESEFMPLFNGRDLSGWDGNSKFWSVQEGCITGETTAANSLSDVDAWLIWKEKGGRVDDFELRLTYKLSNGESGVQYRCRETGTWSVRGSGYHAQIGDTDSGDLHGPDREGNRLSVESGEKTFWASIQRRGWNELVITARSSRLIHQINGKVIVDFTDNEPKFRSLSGLIALQLHRNQRQPMKVQFKDIRLKRLNTSAQPSPATVTPSTGQSVAQAGLKRGLVLLYGFDEPPQAGVVRDLSGTGNDGSIVGARWTAQGKRGGALLFAPTNNYVRVANKDSLNPPQTTLAVWIKTTRKDETWRRILDKSWETGFALSIGGGYVPNQDHHGKAAWEVNMKGRPSGGEVDSDAPVNDGQWHHIAVTYDGAAQRMYVDGQLQKEIRRWRGTMPSNGLDLTIGINLANPNPNFGEVGASFDGSMDEVMIYNRALSAEEVGELCAVKN